ncbi:MAG: hypothetical protein HY758_00780 [Nitrospirae bacterium]|nr:hypothetical protein [Nitrospirota bacterium]
MRLDPKGSRGPGGKKKNKSKKYPCPDCSFCQWCSDDRCGLCRPAGKKCSKDISRRKATS